MHPIVRYFLLAEDFFVSPENFQKVTIVNLLGSMSSVDEPPYPALVREICCVVAVTDGRGKGRVQVVCVNEELDRPVFASNVHEVDLGNDPLDLQILTFRIVDCRFPEPGMYSFRFIWNEVATKRAYLRLR